MRGEQGSASLIPRPIAGVDIRTLPIGPKEAFVLSQVDGQVTDDDIGLFTGLGSAEVRAVLSNLASLGAVHYGNATPQSATGLNAPPSPSGTSGTHVRISQPPSSVPTLYEPEELSEQVDIEDERKRLILSVFYGLEKVTHYELLEVPRTAEKKDIKSAYFDRVALFHPDRYFGKNLGTFKTKLEQIFQRMTEAHDTLTRGQKRQEYDSYLQSVAATSALDTDEAASTAAKIRDELEAEALRANASASPTPSTGSSPKASPAAEIAPEIAPEPSRTPSPEERRQALARKLGGVGIASRVSRPDMAGTLPPASNKDALKTRYEQRLKDLKTSRVARFVEQADHALSANNKVAAANALRIAASLAPEDASLAERLAKVEHEASTLLSGQYLEQARYEEGQRAFDKAAIAYERAAKGSKAAAQLYERASHCLLEARGDARKAVELGRKAVDLAPQTANFRITLARAYARSGLEKSALGELERALAGGAEAETVKDWERRVRRGEV